MLPRIGRSTGADHPNHAAGHGGDGASESPLRTHSAGVSPRGSLSSHGSSLIEQNNNFFPKTSDFRKEGGASINDDLLMGGMDSDGDSSDMEDFMGDGDDNNLFGDDYLEASGTSLHGEGADGPKLSPRTYLQQMTAKRRLDRGDTDDRPNATYTRGRVSPNSQRKSPLSKPLTGAHGSNPVAQPQAVRAQGASLEPLPLLNFKVEVADVVKAISITGDVVHNVANFIPGTTAAALAMKAPSATASASSASARGTIGRMSPIEALPTPSSPSQPSAIVSPAPMSGASSSGSNGSSGSSDSSPQDKDFLHNPQHSRRLSKWFVARAAKELAVRSGQLLPGSTPSNGSGGNGDDDDDGIFEQPSITDYHMYDMRASSRHNNSHKSHKRKSAVSPEQDKNSPDKEKNLGRFCTCSASNKDSNNENYVPSRTNDETPNNTCCPVCVNGKSLAFEANFESGNLLKALRTEGRKSLMPQNSQFNHSATRVDTASGSRSSKSKKSSGPSSEVGFSSSSEDPNSTANSPSFGNTTGLPSIEVDQEYTLWCNKDINTSGNIQWYNFAVITPPDMSTVKQVNSQEQKENPRNASPNTSQTEACSHVTYPLKVRFQIVNMMKKDALYNYGMRPTVMCCPAPGSNGNTSTNTGTNSSDPMASPSTVGSPPAPATPTTSLDTGAYGEWRHLGEDICYYRNGLVNETIDSLGVPAAQSLSEHMSSGPAIDPNSADGTSASASMSNSAASSGKKKKRVKHFYTLAFTYIFMRPGDTVYFAHCYPYTYTDLQVYLHSLEKSEKYNAILQRRLLCNTIAGNRCDLLTITARPVSGSMAPASSSTAAGTAVGSGDGGATNAEVDDDGGASNMGSAMAMANKPVIVITARVHPGESNSSYAMHGVLDFLLGDSPDAAALRNTFVFKIVPMMNPDGVIHGNYRCSLAGTDLNRRYANCSSYMHPPVHAIRGLLSRMHESRQVLLYLDLHGHSKNKNVFLYGCDIVMQPEPWLREDLDGSSGRAAGNRMTRTEVITQRVFVRTFPTMLCAMSNSQLAQKNEQEAAAAAAYAIENGRAQQREKYVEQDGLVARERAGFFSLQDSKFTVSKSKRGTGRVVAFKDVMIDGSYTVELSFCGLGDNNESKILKKADERGFDVIYTKELEILALKRKKEAIAKKKRDQVTALADSNHDGNSKSGVSFSKSAASAAAAVKVSADQNERNLEAATAAAFATYEKSMTSSKNPGINSNAFTTGVGAAPSANLNNPQVLADYNQYKNLMGSYKTATHFTKQDLVNVGKDLCLVISEFANLPQAYDFRSGASPPPAPLPLIPSSDQGEKHSKFLFGTSSIKPSTSPGESRATIDREAFLRIVKKPLPPAQQPETPFYDSSSVHAPMLHPTVFSLDASHSLQRMYPDEFGPKVSKRMGKRSAGISASTSDLALEKGNVPNNTAARNVGTRMIAEMEIAHTFGYVLENPMNTELRLKQEMMRANGEDAASLEAEVSDTGNDDTDAASMSQSMEGGSTKASLSSNRNKVNATKGSTSKSKKLSVKSKKGKTAGGASSEFMEEFSDFLPTPGALAEVESDGSDSDPSVDNVPAETMMRRMSRKGTDADGKGMDIASMMRAHEIKRRRSDAKDAKVAHVLEKRKMAALQRQQFLAYQEERLIFEQQQAKKTFANSIPAPTPIVRRQRRDRPPPDTSNVEAAGASSTDGHVESRKYRSDSNDAVAKKSPLRKEKVATRSRVMPKQRRVYLTHAPSYKLANEYDDDTASITPAGSGGAMSDRPLGGYQDQQQLSPQPQRTPASIKSQSTDGFMMGGMRSSGARNYSDNISGTVGLESPPYSSDGDNPSAFTAYVAASQTEKVIGKMRNLRLAEARSSDRRDGKGVRTSQSISPRNNDIISDSDYTAESYSPKAANSPTRKSSSQKVSRFEEVEAQMAHPGLPLSSDGSMASAFGTDTSSDRPSGQAIGSDSPEQLSALVAASRLRSDHKNQQHQRPTGTSGAGTARVQGGKGREEGRAERVLAMRAKLQQRKQENPDNLAAEAYIGDSINGSTSEIHHTNSGRRPSRGMIRLRDTRDSNNDDGLPVPLSIVERFHASGSGSPKGSPKTTRKVSVDFGTTRK